MNLRNKKTGEIGFYLHTHREHKTGAIKVAVLKDGVSFSEFKPNEPIYDYDSLAELNEEWEDYYQKEPLIKEPKIRKAVKAWAEASSNGIVFYEGADGSNSIGRLKGYQSNFVAVFDLGRIISYELEDNKQYTIEELCGKEE